MSDETNTAPAESAGPLDTNAAVEMLLTPVESDSSDATTDKTVEVETPEPISCGTRA